MDDRRVLVTGATGFLGQHLTRLLIDLGVQVWAGVYPGESAERVEALPSAAHRISLDIRRTDSVQAAVDSCEPNTVVHLAAVGVTDSQIDPLTALEINTAGTIRLLEALRPRDVRRIVLTGTCHEYGAKGLDPSSFYAASKVAAWAYARAYWRSFGLPVVIARLFQVYGPGQPANTLIPAAVRAALEGRDFEMTPGEQERDFVYVDDVIDGLVAAAVRSGIDGQSLDLGTGQTNRVRDVVERIWHITNASGNILAGALQYRPGMVRRLAADAARTDSLLGWQARVGLEAGLHRTIRHMESTSLGECS